MTTIDVEDSYFFSSYKDSDTKTIGSALTRSADGSSFSVQLDRPITIPADAKGVTVECVSANILHVTPNIAEAYGNNHMYLQYLDSDLNYLPIDLLLPDGNYTSSTLNDQVQRLLSQINVPPLNTTKFAPGSIIVSGNSATQKIIITLAKDLQLMTNDTLANRVNLTIGFPEGPEATYNYMATYNGQSFEAPNPAKMNRVNAYLLHSSIVQGGIPLNNGSANVLAEIQVNTVAGGLILHRPYIPLRVSGDHLKNSQIGTVTIWLTDEKNRATDTVGEDYSVTISIRYKRTV